MKNKLPESAADIINLVWASERAMPAHFTGNGDRKQSFCIDFDGIDAKDEYQMASASYLWIMQYLKPEDNLTQEQHAPLTRYGEDIMIGSYITEKLKMGDKLDEVISGLTQMNRDTWPKEINALTLWETRSAKDWFKFCKEYGVQVAHGKYL